MNTLIKALNNQQKPSTKWISSIGTIIGLVIILITVQLFQDFNPIIKNTAVSAKSDFQVISKKINELSFLNNTIKGFSAEEIQELKKQKNIKDIAPFLSCNYKVMINVGNQKNGIPGFYTLAFFESIPQRFITKNEEFSNWDSSSIEVPVILPQNYLDAYNYGLALSMNTPQISTSFLKKLRFNIEISGQSKKESFVGKIVGLSNNLNSILVPEKFLNLTNINYGSKEIQNPTRVIIKTHSIDEELFIDFLNKKNYVVNDNSQKTSMIYKILMGLFSYQLLIAFIIISQGLLLLLFYAQIIIQSSKEIIKKLFIMGYSPNEVAKAFEKELLKLYLSIFSLSLIISVLLKYLIANEFISNLGIKINYTMSFNTYLIWGLIVLTFFITNRINLKRRLKSISTQIYI